MYGLTAEEIAIVEGKEIANSCLQPSAINAICQMSEQPLARPAGGILVKL